MLSFFYSFFIWIYQYLVTAIALFNGKAKLRITGLRSQSKTLASTLQTISNERILVHCSSLGEYEQSRPIIRKILLNTDLDLVVSFFSPSGYDDAQLDNELRIVKCYLPFDRKSLMKKFFNEVNPKKVVIIKNEWWWNMLALLKRRNIPTHLVSSTIRKDHYFIKYPFSFFKKTLEAFTSIFTVDQSSSDLLQRMYSGNIMVSGDSRLDQVMDIRQNHSKNKSALYTMIHGSIWISDLHIIKRMIELKPNVKHILYPHNLSDQNIANISNQLQGVEIIDTIVDSNSPGIYINNSMGSLKQDYSAAHLAYIGGGFGEGVHNILEAVVFEIPTIIGPNFNKSREAIELISKDCVFSVNGTIEIAPLFQKLEDLIFLNKIELTLKTYFSESNSASDIIYSSIFK